MAAISRREALGFLAGSAASSLGCTSDPPRPSISSPNWPEPEPESGTATAAEEAIVSVSPLGRPPWPTLDPFLFCVHHLDSFPAGNAQMGPAESLSGRRMGNDFANVNGWNMYHGEVVPGFPRHPHRGFETVTVVRRGLLDHADSLGATARYGEGDVQ